MSEKTHTPKPLSRPTPKPVHGPVPADQPVPKPEIGGRGGLDPARYGDWEIGGKCVDF